MVRILSMPIRSRLPAPAAAYRGAWVVLVYSALRYLALERHDHTYGDSTGYHAAAQLPLFSVEFWAGLRSFTIPLFWKLLGNNEPLTTSAQFVISVVCWLVLAWAIAGLSNVRLVRWVACLLVLGLSLTGPVAQWDRALLSESLSYSLMVLLVALAIRLINDPDTGRSQPRSLVAAALGIRARHQRVYRGRCDPRPRCVSTALAEGKRGRSRGRPCWNDRDRHSRGGVILSWEPLRRTLSNWSQSSDFLRTTRRRSSGCGHMATRLRRRLNTVAVFRHYLLLHPGELFGAMFRDEPTYAPWPASEKRLKALYTPDVTPYEKSPARWRLPMSVQRVFTPSTPGWLIIELAILAVLVGLALKRHRPDRMWLVPLTLLIGAYPQLLVLWDVDGLEPDRHALGAMVEIRIAMIIALVLALTVLVPGMARGRRCPSPHIPSATTVQPETYSRRAPADWVRGNDRRAAPRRRRWSCCLLDLTVWGAGRRRSSRWFDGSRPAAP